MAQQDVIHECPNAECGRKNRVPTAYTGIAVCADCRTPMFETKIVPSKSNKREFTIRWTRRDWHLVLPVILLSFPIHWALRTDMISRIGEVAVYMTILTAIALAWLIVGVALKVSWEEFWRAKKEREMNPPEPDTIDNLAAWEAASEYARKAREYAAGRIRTEREN